MRKKKVMLGMSGGVDSSVAAAVLLEQGYDVIGVTLKIWEDDNCNVPEIEGGCCSLSAVEDARSVANKLGIPYYVMNFKDIFQNKVINYFTEEYLQGRTPNPCIACNRYIKFEEMLNKAVSMGIDYVATGHYAIIEYDKTQNRYLLKKSITDTKDQTYALYNLTQQQLSKVLMPIGNYTKDKVREIAKDLGLPVFNKPDSQEICFVKDNDYAGFIEKNTTSKIPTGNFIDKNGNFLGKHKGIVHYTIGQRKGLGIALGRPMFVVDIDAKTNNVILGDEDEVFSNGLIANDLNFISIDKLNEPLLVKAKVRYSSKGSDATIYPLDEDRVKVVFKEKERAITKGQSVVFYNDDVVVGGGRIIEIL